MDIKSWLYESYRFYVPVTIFPEAKYKTCTIPPQTNTYIIYHWRHSPKMVVCGPKVEVQVLHPIETVIRGLQYNKLIILCENMETFVEKQFLYLKEKKLHWCATIFIEYKF